MPVSSKKDNLDRAEQATLMADRARAGRGASGPSARGRGGGRAGADDKPKREAILDLAKFSDKRVRVKFMGGREITGILKGYDQLLNLVMDEVEEIIREPEGASTSSPSKTRSLGLAVIRGTSLVLINPVDGYEEIANPFVNQQ